MNKVGVFCGLVVSHVFLTSLRAAPFEGVITFTTALPHEPPKVVTYKIRNGRLRIEAAGAEENGAVVMDPSKRSAIMISDARHEYLTVPAIGPLERPDDKTHLQVEKTKQSGVVSGYPVEKWIVTDDLTRTELWLSHDLGVFATLNFWAESESRSLPGSETNFALKGVRVGSSSAGPLPAPAWERALGGSKLFPLRVVTTDKTGGETFRMEVTAVEKASLPESLFTPPANYQHVRFAQKPN